MAYIKQKVAKMEDDDGQSAQMHVNLQLATTIYKNIKSYGFLHAGNALTPSIIEAIRMNLPGMVSYFESRMITI